MNKVEFLPGVSAYFEAGISLEHILELSSEQEWDVAGVVDLENPENNVVSKNLRDASTKRMGKFRDEISQSVATYVADYAEQHNLEDLELEGFSFVKYEEGQFYKEHSDNGKDVHRRVSMVIYLNDDYQGGELYFTKFKSVIKPKAETLVLFPSDERYMHAAQIVTSGTKYALIGFWK